MRKLLTLLFVIFSLCDNIQAQELRFEDLENIYNNRDKLDECERFLAEKNFYFFQGHENEENKISYQFTLNRKKGNEAESFAIINYNCVQLQTIHRSTKDYFQNTAKSKGLILTETAKLENGLIFVYKSEEHFLSIVIAPDIYKENSTIFVITYQKK